MPAAPSVGTTSFAPQVDDLLTDAYLMIGVRDRSGLDARLGMRQLQLMLLNWSNQGVYSWGTDSTSVALIIGTATYAMPERAQRVLDVLVRSSASVDRMLSPISRNDYWSLTNKTTTGAPTCYWHDSQQASTGLTLWPVPNAADTLVVSFHRQLTDTTTMTQVIDVPTRFLPAAVSGLAARLARIRPETTVDPVRLEAIAEAEWRAAWEADRERVDVRFTL